ncbi:putative ribonuclease H-like domain-containing protein [Tanacetum coccineum]|uniref:Ribonuclease H-like domain-containing protein n=1 Tax=Tanacetum coccineum TaxID=301880 RepID=A0ABQ5BHC3_9ASTR
MLFVSSVQKQRELTIRDFLIIVICFFLSQHEPRRFQKLLKMKAGLMLCKKNCCSRDTESLGLSRFSYGRKAIGTKVGLSKFKKDERRSSVRNKQGFLDPKYPQKVYKVVKALYGLHQAPRAWYATLSTFLLKNGYRRGTIDKTLFIKKDKHDIILVQMSSMGELTFFLGLQVKQKEDGIFISQDKYVAEILKKFDFANVKTASTPIETQKPLVKDEEASDVDVHLYRSMIGSLMYLTASRPDIMFAVCACSRFQVTPKSSHLSAVKRIFRYLKGKPKLGLWYPRVSSFDLESYSDSDYAGENLDRKSTTGGCQFLGSTMAVLDSCPKHNMVAYLEKSEGNAEFHEIIDFLKRSSIHHALIVSPVVSTTFVEQFLELLSPQNQSNNVRHITAKVAGKSVSISEASIRSFLLFDDADGIDSLPNVSVPLDI